jgi:uncharacterized protein YdaU (DUF1376 family)
VNHYPRHVGDYIRDTVGLTMLEDGAYGRLLDQYYAREAPLPIDKPTLYRIARATSKQERAAVDSVLAQFFSKSADGWRQKRADAEITRYSDRSAMASELARRRWNKGNANAMPTHMPTHMPKECNGNANQNHNQNHITSKAKTTPKPPKPMLGAEAPHGVRDEVWESWRRHKGKKLTADAYRLQSKVIARAIADGHDPNAMIEASIANGWAGLFPPKANGPPGAVSIHDRRAATARAMFGTPTEKPNEPAIDSTAKRVA